MKCEVCGTTDDVEIRHIGQMRTRRPDISGDEPDETLCDGCFYDEYMYDYPDQPDREDYIEQKRRQRAA